LQPDRAQASQMLRHVADQLRPKWPKLAALIDDSETDVLSYLDFPEPHRSKLHSTDEIDKDFRLAPSRSWNRSCSPELAAALLSVEGTVARGLLGSGFVNADSRRRRWPRRPAFTKPLPSSDNRPWRLRGCSVPKARRRIAQCLLRTKFAACGILGLHGRPRGEEQGWRMKALPRSL